MKEWIFYIGLLVSLPLGVFAASFSRRIRELVFAALIFGTTCTDWLDINLISREWYRGTTRGTEISFVDILALILLISTLMTLRQEGGRPFWPKSLGWLLAYLAYCCFNVLICDPKLFGLFELMKIVRASVVFLGVVFFVRSDRDIRLLLLALCGVAFFLAVVSLRDRYLYGIYRVSATFAHPNNLSTYCCFIAPILIAAVFASIPNWIRALAGTGAVLLAGCVILTVSRMGFATFALMSGCTLAICMGLSLSPRNIAIAALAAIAACGMLYKSWDTLAGRFGEASLRDEYFDDGLHGRGLYFRLLKPMITEHFFGSGLNNWSYWVTNEYGPRIGLDYHPYIGTRVPPDQDAWSLGLDTPQAAPAHSLLVLTLGELGWPGLLIFVGLWIQWYRMALVFLFKRTPALVSRFGLGVLLGLTAALMQNMTEFTFRQTAIIFLSQILLGALAAIHNQRRKAPRPAPKATLKETDSRLSRLSNPGRTRTAYPTSRPVH